MANKDTLELSKFGGIDRYDRGTNTPPNLFETLQNFHPVSLGELKSISGVVDRSGGADLPGVNEIIHTAIHKDFGGDEKLLLFFKPSIDYSSDWKLSDITISNFTSSGGTPVSRSYYVVLYGPGGCYRTKVVGGTLEVNITFTPPSLPDWICQINIYEIDETTSVLGINSQWNGALVATMNRYQGVFPASVTFGPRVNSTNNTLNRIEASFSKVAFSSSSGALIPGKIYYYGICPYVTPTTLGALTQRYPRVSLVQNPGTATPLAFTVPNGLNTASVRLYFPNISGGGAAVTSAGTEVTKAWMFLGTTPEDVQLSSPAPVDLTQFETELLISGIGSGSFTANGYQNTNSSFIPNVEDGTPIRYTAAGTAPTGLVNNTVYWIRLEKLTSGYLIRFATSKANLDAGTFITSGGAPTGTHYITQQVVNYTFRNPPENSNNNVYMCEDDAVFPTRNLGGSNQQGDATRTDGAFVQSQFFPAVSSAQDYRDGYDLLDYPSSGSTNRLLGCWSLDAKTFSMATARQLIANVNDKGFSLTGQLFYGNTYNPLYVTEPQIGPTGFWAPSDNVMTSKQLTIRTYLANGDNSLFYTNAYVLKPIVRANGKVRVPTSKYITAFNSRLVCGGGDDSFQNSRNQVYYSEPDLPFDWGASAPNTINVFSGQDINGFGAYSQNLTTSGFAQYLMISKKDGLFSWDGDSSNGAQQLYYGFGFASPNAFTETDQGPVIVARDNVYSLVGGQLKEIGDEVSDILKGLTDTQLDQIVCTYHDKITKIGYPSASSGLDREIWLDRRIEQGQLMQVYSGPHVMTPYVHQCTSVIFGADRDVRFAARNKRFYQLDTGDANNGANISRSIVISRLGMNANHFWKVMTDIYLATLVTADTTFTITLDFEDGSAQYVGTLSSPVANTRQLCQHLIRSRPRGRIAKLTIAQSSSAPVSIFNIGMLFALQKRRLLRYT